MNKQDIEKYLRTLGQELQQRQVTGEILLAGGAVMLLKVQNREITKDIMPTLIQGKLTLFVKQQRWLQTAKV